MFTNQPANGDRFKLFCDQLQEFTKSMENERSRKIDRNLVENHRIFADAVEKAMKQTELQQAEGEAAFAERVAEDKAKFTAQKEILDAELRKLTDFDEKLTVQRKEWKEKQEEAHGELMAQLEGRVDEVLAVENHFGEQFDAFIDSMNNLSYQSMNDQFVVLKNNLDSLSIEKKQLKVAIDDQNSTIGSMSTALAPTCGVTYKERNALRVALLNQVTKVRTEYQKSRLLEESLKAKLAA